MLIQEIVFHLTPVEHFRASGLHTSVKRQPPYSFHITTISLLGYQICSGFSAKQEEKLAVKKGNI